VRLPMSFDSTVCTYVCVCVKRRALIWCACGRAQRAVQRHANSLALWWPLARRCCVRTPSSYRQPTALCGCGTCDVSRMRWRRLALACVAVHRARKCMLDCHSLCSDLVMTLCACGGGGGFAMTLRRVCITVLQKLRVYSTEGELVHEIRNHRFAGTRIGP